MKKEVIIIAAMADKRVIGKANKLPWHYSADLKKFKAVTAGATVVMGRRTFESIGRPLPDRENLVLTGGPLPSVSEKVKFFNSLENAIRHATHQKVFIIGGESVYRRALELNFAIRICLTRIHESHEGDAYFPEIPPCFVEKSREKIQDQPLIEFIVYENTSRVLEVA